MSLPSYAPGVFMSADMIRVESRNGGTWDINNSVSRRIGKRSSGQISFYDFYGNSYEQRFNFYPYGANYCSNPIYGYLSDYVNIPVGDNFQLVIAFQGSWAPINGTYPAIEVFCTKGVPQSFDIGSTTGGKSAHMTFGYDGGDVFVINGYYTGGSTNFPCATVYILDLVYPEPGNRGSGINITGVYWPDYVATKTPNTNFIQRWTPPPPPPEPPPGDGSSSGPSCFPAGTPVIMADGSIKMIEFVKIGDQVLGAYGEINTILAYDRTILGQRPMYLINKEHRTTDTHTHITDRNTLASLLSDTLGLTGTEKSLDFCTVQDIQVDEQGTIERIMHPGLPEQDVELLEEMKIGTILKTNSGLKPVETITSYTMPADTILYNFIVGGSHTYHVDGYAVTGFANGRDFDYRTWTYKTASWTLDDYRKFKG